MNSGRSDDSMSYQTSHGARPQSPDVGPNSFRGSEVLAASQRGLRPGGLRLRQKFRLALGTEWPTVLLFLGTYSGLPIGLTVVSQFGVSHPLSALIWLVMIYLTTLHASLQHEALHGHPFRDVRLNTLLASIPLGLFIPYLRFKRLHLRHHKNEMLTDPYDDPETFYLAHRNFLELPMIMRALLQINNTLIGRLTLGPILSLVAFYRSEIRIFLSAPVRRKQLLNAWGQHAIGITLVAFILSWVGLPFWFYVLAIAYPAMSLLMLRTFAEHQAAEEVGQRTAIVEASPIFALLYLNNNLHFVHHEFPNAAWYELPGLYRTHHKRVLSENGDYRIQGYGDLFARFSFRRKEQVEHPFMRR